MITVSGNLYEISGSASTTSFVRFWLRGTGGNQPFVSGTALLAPDGGNTWYADFFPSGSGAVTGNLYSTSQVTVGGVTGAIYYGMQVFQNGFAGPEAPVSASGNININNPNILTNLPVVSAPTGDSTYLRLDGTNSPVTGPVEFSSSIKADSNIISKISPVYDVTAYGAVGDGATDDTAAIQAALTAANAAGGGRVVIPATIPNYCLCTGQLVMDGFVNVTLEGETLATFGGNPRAWIRFTGTSSPLISMKSANACGIRGVYVQSNAIAFSGTMVDCQHSGLATDSTKLTFKNCYFSGVPGQHNVGIFLSLDKTLDSIVEDCFFTEGVVCIRGASGAGSYSVNNIIRGCHFSTSTGTISTAFIQNMTDSTLIQGNTFELGNGAGTPKVVDYTATTVPCRGLAFQANWVGDANGASTYTALNLTPPCVGVDISGGNSFGLSATSTIIVIGDGSVGVRISGNYFTTASVGISIVGVAVNDCEIAGNNYTSITTFISGTPNNGRVHTPSGGGTTYNDNIYGTLSVSQSITTAVSLVSTVATGTAPITVSSTTVVPNLTVQRLAKVSNYNAIATAGNGVASVFGATSQKGETGADTNVLTYTPPATAGTYRIHFILSLSAANTATLGWTATWKDSNGNAQTPTNLSLFQEGTAAPALTFATSSTGNYYGTAIIDIDNSATNIVVKLTFTGTSFAGKASAVIEQLI